MKKKALIYFIGFADSFGGAEYLPLLFVKWLQSKYDVTMAVNWIPCDPYRAVEAYDVELDFKALKFVELKPKSRFCQKLDAVIPFFSVRRLQRLAKDADLCISCANMIDFGRPAHHFIYLLNRFGDNAFIDYYSHAAPLTGKALFTRLLRTFLAESVLRPLLRCRSARKMLADPRERFYATSDYVADTMRGFYGTFNNETFYPPTVFEFDGAPTVPRDPLSVIYIGRISALKKVREIIVIVERARAISGLGLKLRIAGAMDANAYVEGVRAMAAERPWIELPGPLYNEAKRDFILGGTFALHACRCETLGISVVEYLKAGVIPVVPDEGGVNEVVAEPDLAYADDETAARILARLATDDAFRGEMARRCAARSHVFSRDAYLKRQSDLLERIAGT